MRAIVRWPLLFGRQEINVKREIKDAADYEALYKREKLKYIGLSAAGIILFLSIWEISVRTGLVNPSKLVPPSQILAGCYKKLWDKSPDGATLMQNLFASLRLSLSGFGMAIIIGTPLGLLMGWYKPVQKLVNPIFELIRPIPAIAWIPLIILVLGIGNLAKSFIIFFAAFVPIVINSYTGIRQVNKTYVNFSRTCGASNWTIFLKVGVPSSLPMIFGGYKVSLGNAWSTLVAAEMLASDRGLGYMILMGRQYGKINIILMGMAVIGVVGVILYALLSIVEGYVVKGRFGS